MGELIFRGTKPFEIALQTHPTTTAEGEIVVVTLPVYAPDTPEGVFELRVLLSIRQAEYLHAQIEPALITARVNARLGR